MKSTQKIIAGLLTFAMVLTLVVGLTVAKADAYTFTRSLTVGSRGDDVRALQEVLAEKGFFTVAPTGYFGNITKRAVAAWQASAGVSPALGYFGPISRAAMGNPTTTGTGTPSPISTTEGTLDVTLATTPSNNANIQTTTDNSVYGVTLKAKLGDVRVDRADLKVAVTSSGTAENPGNFINTIKAMDGSTVLKTWSVGTGDFVKDSSGNYYIRLSDIGLVVPKDGSKTLVFAISTNGGIDNSRTVVISGYGTNSLRTSSGAGIVTYYDISTASVAARTHTFVKPGAATLSLLASAENPASSTIRIDSTATYGAENVVMQKFAVKSVTGQSVITTVAVTSTSSATGASNLYLYDGSERIGAITNASSTSFTNLAIVVPAGTTKTLTIKADFPANTTSGTLASTTVTSVTYEKPNGTTASATGTIAGNDMYFYSASANLTFVSGTAAANGQINNSPSGLTGTFTLKVKPEGGSMTVPDANSFVTQFASSASAVNLTNANQTVTVAGDPSVLAEGSEYTVTLVSTVASTSLSSGTYPVWFKITGATTTVNGVTTQQTWGLSSFRTSSVTWAE